MPAAVGGAYVCGRMRGDDLEGVGKAAVDAAMAAGGAPSIAAETAWLAASLAAAAE